MILTQDWGPIFNILPLAFIAIIFVSLSKITFETCKFYNNMEPNILFAARDNYLSLACAAIVDRITIEKQLLKDSFNLKFFKPITINPK